MRTGRQLVNRHSFVTHNSRFSNRLPLSLPAKLLLPRVSSTCGKEQALTRAEINRLTKQRGKVPWLRFYRFGGFRSAQLFGLSGAANFGGPTVGLQKPRNRSSSIAGKT